MPLTDQITDTMLQAAALVSDVDGTLTAGDFVNERTCAALAGAAATGTPVALLTGRNAAAARSILDRAGAPGWVGAFGGAVVLDPSGRVVRASHLDPAEYQPLAECGIAAGAAAVWYGSQGILASRSNAPVDFMFRSQHLPERYGTEPDFAVHKVMLVGEAEVMDRLEADLAAAAPRAQRSMDIAWEMGPLGAEKAAALTLICAELGIEPGQVIGFGDGGNDLDWLPLTGHAIVPAGARPQVQAIAELIVPPVEQDGVAQFIEAWTAARVNRH